MPAYQHIIDNRSSSAADYLRRALDGASGLSLVSAYFSIYGFELLQRQLEELDSVRFLYGDRGSIEEVDPNPESKSFHLAENQLHPSRALEQRALAIACHDWVKRDGVEVRAVTRSNFLHGKMYLTDGGDDDPDAKGLVGSSNFTKSGLGGGLAGNLEINLAVDDAEALAELHQWFNEVWDAEYTVDVKAQLLAELERVGANHSPRDVYFKTLYEIFRAEIENDELTDFQKRIGTLKESAVWNTLYGFQQDGALNAIRRLEQYGGCILADSVGLGKTYTALAAIKYYELRNLNVLVLCPKKLFENWRRYQITSGFASNPFRDDRFGYTLMAHTDLSRDLADFNWSNYDLLVIDESHNFRNRLGKRYEKLLADVINSGTDTNVLMLTATPVNTKLEDLEAQLGLMTGGEPGRLSDALGIRNVTGALSNAKSEFMKWQGANNSSKEELVDKLGADFKLLLDRVSIARSRKHVTRYYSAEMDRIGDFPTRLKPVELAPHTDLQGEMSYKAIGDEIANFKMAIYLPSHFMLSGSPSDRQIQTYLVQMIKVNFLKRLESSAHSLRLTLERTIAKMERVIQHVEQFESNQATDRLNAEVDITDTMDDDTEDTLAPIQVGKLEYNLFAMDIAKWKPLLVQDRNLLAGVLDEVRKIGPERDGKLAALRTAISDRLTNPTDDKDGNRNRKLLVFTTFKDTAEYLYDQLQPDLIDAGINFAMVAGDAVRASTGRNDFQEVLSRFAPVARNRSGTPDDEIDLLIATDCISEGQDLQDCDRIINYDIHWNPVRLTQRFGRIDRIGSTARNVQMTNYWPTQDMEEQIDLKRRVVARSALADALATADYDPLSDDADEDSITYRDEQLRAMRTENIDIEDLDDVVTLSDFTLDHFRAQLAQFMDLHKSKLEQMPLGVYALTCHSEQRSFDSPTTLDPGVIWCFRQTNASAGRDSASPSAVFPCYLVYITTAGNIRYGCTNAERILHLFEDTCIDKPDPLLDLCDTFDRETQLGRDMSLYNKLLRECLGHVRQAANASQAQGLGTSGRRDFALLKDSDYPSDDIDFELVTWLIIR